MCVRAKADKIGTPGENAVILIRTDDIDYESEEIKIESDAFSDYLNVWENNPKTGLAWTKAQVAALEAGIRASQLDNGENIKCSEIWVVVNYTPFDFSISASPSSLSVKQASSVSTTVHVTLTSGTAEPVSLTGSWVGTAPAGVNPSFTPSSGTPNFGSTLTFETTAAATVGTFTYRVISTGDGQTHTTDVSLEITELLPYVGEWVEEILNFLRQMGPAVLIILGFVVLFAGITKSLAVLVGAGFVICGLLILLGFL